MGGMPKKPKAPEPQRPLRVGDRVHRDGTKAVWCITWISEDGRFANISMEQANLEWFRIPVESLTRAD